MRRPASKGKADSNQRAIVQALKLIGVSPLDLHGVGGGCEDLLLPLSRVVETVLASGDSYEWRQCFWVMCECKVAKNKRGEATPSQFTPAQVEWREKTDTWPRITVTSGQDAVDQVRALTERVTHSHQQSKPSGISSPSPAATASGPVR